VSDVEFHLPRPSYTIDTLTYLSEKHPDKEFVVILGEDNLDGFVRWKNHERILEYYGLYVYPRPQSKPSPLINHPRVRMVQAPLVDISATFIRDCVRQGRSVRYLVPDPVEALIRLKKYYL
jgi:nicotinate-nucleotide adenylyltransferase